VVKRGEILLKKQSPMDIYQFLKERAELLPDEHKRFISPHIYKTGITQKLMETRNKLAKQIKNLF
jgi:nicotinate phosphoribosyltransferase